MDITVDLQDDDNLRRMFNSLKSVKDYLDRPDCQEININGPDLVFGEFGGKREQLEVKLSSLDTESAIQWLADRGKKEIKENSADAPCYLNEEWEGFRVAATLPPITLWPTMSIRKHSVKVIRLLEFVNSGALPAHLHQFVIDVILGHKNILIVGGTSSGKTTWFNSLAQEMDPFERVLSIEDTRELMLPQKDMVSFKTNKTLGVTATTAVEIALRYSPSRIFVGELRDGVAYDFLQTMNTGHDGGMATIHASSLHGGLVRLDNLAMMGAPNVPHAALQLMVASTINYVFFVSKREGKRGLRGIAEVQGFDRNEGVYKLNYIYDEKEQNAQILQKAA